MLGRRHGTDGVVIRMAPAEDSGGTPRQGILLAAAMFVFVIDTSFMNVSISAVVDWRGASLYLPAMQSLIHGNFDGKTRAKVFALVGASGAIAAAIGPLIGGFVTTLLSWRVGFLIEALIIAVVLLGSRGIRDVPYTGDRSIDVTGAFLSVIGMGGLVIGVLAWQEGGESVALLLAIGAAAMAGLVYWLIGRKRQGKPTLLD